MNATYGIEDERAALLEAFAAELASDAYRIALRHGLGDGWIDLELELWRALGDVVKRWDGSPARFVHIDPMTEVLCSDPG